MSDLTVRLSKLSPEKQGMLLQRIRQQAGYRGGWCEPEPATETRPFSPADQNYVMRISEIGDLDNLIFEACPRQPPKPGEVEIEIYASSLNFRDVMTALGLYPHASSRDRLLGDCAGKVVAVGDGVQDYRVGDEVLALVSHPYSAFTLVKSKYVAFKPADMSFAEAATIMTVYSTVYYSLYHLARLSRGESVLIHSAAGGVGLAAVQMAQWLGADIIASVGSEQKREYLRSLGVEQIVSSKNPDFDEEVLALTGGKGVDVVLNSLAGDAIIKGLALLKPLGRFIELGKRDVFGSGKLDLALFRKFVSFSTVDLGMVSLQPFFPSMFAEIMDLFTKGVFRIMPIQEFAIGEIAEAFKYMSRREHIGKIVLRVSGEPVWLTTRRLS